MESVQKGQNVVVGDPTRRTPRETRVDAMHDDRRFPQGPSDIEDLTEIKRREFQSLRANDADATTRNSSLNAIPDSLPCGNGVNSEEGRHVFELHHIGKLPMLTNMKAPAAGRLTPPAEPEDAIMSKLDVSPVRVSTLASLEDRLHANAQESLKLNEEVKAVFQEKEHYLEAQMCSILRKEHDVTALQTENQQLHELIRTLKSRVAQVVELQHIACEIRKEFGQVRQDVNDQLTLWCAELQHIDIPKAIAGHNCGLQKRLRECQMLLGLTTEDINLKTREGQELKETILILEEANSKLEQKIEKIQQQLCKEKSGQHGSYVDGLQTPFLVESTAKAMFSSISTFSNLLSKYKDLNGNNPWLPFISNYAHNRQLRITREHHWTYLLKECVCCHLFEDFETERLMISSGNRVIFLDHEERMSRCSEYFKNCNLDKKVWHRAILHESSEKLDHLFFNYFAFRCVNLLTWDFDALKRELSQNYDERFGARIQEQMLGLALDQQKLVESLVVAAGKVWQFHKLCLSFEPPATIFRVSAGDPFNPDYMESIDVLENDDHGSLTVPKVAFMTYPGFRLRKSIVKCQVYLSTNIEA